MGVFKSCSKNIFEEKHGALKYRDNFKADIEKNRSHSEALKSGFVVDETYDVYVKEGYGAFCFNISRTIKRVDDLITFYDDVLKCNPYHKVVDLMRKGYKFTFGPAFPMTNGEVSNLCVGLYCKNFVEMKEKENAKQATL